MQNFKIEFDVHFLGIGLPMYQISEPQGLVLTYTHMNMAIKIYMKK